ncbi:AsmA2 domain-containing protein YhdP [Rosenbergiella nectarea]|uniref:AsmA2 domain-containing protein YhdP n=1 Tax=Rosenbergiella nectarea TaxID=988801 RepID=UPI001BD98BA9|nr:AsmA2 domain-containing protein [Rosenbergiella nectarea subsp. apis]
MSRLSQWTLRIITALIVIAALLVTALRLAMPYMDHYRSQLLSAASAATGIHFSADKLQGEWKSFGPTLNVDNFSAELADGGKLQIKRVTLALDIWQSLLHANLQFRDLTFWQLHFFVQQFPEKGSSPHNGYDSNKVKNLFLQRFDHFILRESTIDFPSPSGQRVTLNIPTLTWFNEGKLHRAEGLVNLSSFTGQHGTAQLRVNLQDKQQLLDKGTIWIKVDDIDAKPWLGNWVNKNTNLKKAHLSVMVWLNMAEGALSSGEVIINRGDAEWQEANQAAHQLTLTQLSAKLSRVGKGFVLTLPDTGITIDNTRWPRGSLALNWQADSKQPWLPAENSAIRVRAANIELARLTPLVPLLSPLQSTYAKFWQQANPQGRVTRLAADIPLQDMKQTRIAAQWQQLSWQAFQKLPAVTGFSGSLTGGMAQGESVLELGPQTLASQGQLQAPLELNHFSGVFSWQRDDDNLALSGQDIDVSAKSVAAKGDFSYQQSEHRPPNLQILAGINATDGADAWRYFPIKIMPKGLVHYLSTAIQGGKAKDATLVFAGDPHQFPFTHNEGTFQVTVPLKQAKFAFQPGWPALSPLDIDLNFVNNGLWMKADAIRLGNVPVTQVTADIPDYHKEQLLIEGDIRGQGDDIHRYMKQTPLANSVGSALDQLKVDGEVYGHLGLTIPLDGKEVIAKGDVNLKNNQLTIVPLQTQMKGVTGRFTYNNGHLQSTPISARWFGQPIKVNFSTEEQAQQFAIDVQASGDWALEKINAFPKTLHQQLIGRLPWHSQVAIALPHQGGATYRVKVVSDATKVGGKLPDALGVQNKPFPLSVNATGNLSTLQVSGVIDNQQRFTTQWKLSPKLALEKGQWTSQTDERPSLPMQSMMDIRLPALEGDKLMATLQNLPSATSSSAKKTVQHPPAAQDWRTAIPFELPRTLQVTTPALTLYGQQWRNLSLKGQQLLSQPLLSLNSDEARGNLQIRPGQPWLLNMDYLYYNPQFSVNRTGQQAAESMQDNHIDFSQWPKLDATCSSCWFAGQNFGQIKGKFSVNQQTLTLREGAVDTGRSRLSVMGEWSNVSGQERTALKGHLRTDNVEDAAHWFGVEVPVSDTPLHLGYDLHWKDVPWRPSIKTLSGLLTLNAGKGTFRHIETGTAGQVLRLLSLDALLRKVSLDFRGTLDSGFYYDSITGTAWLDKGILHTENLNIDGLEADIGMRGEVNFTNRQFDLLATVAPEISVPVGVAAAFAINPIVGASVVVASKVLSPIWSKISLLRYSITGPMDKPDVKEVLRK